MGVMVMERDMVTLSANEQTVYDLLADAAANNRVCPLNIDIEVDLGYDSCSMGSWIISRLELKGLIVVSRQQRFRQVMIVATGQWTARSAQMHADRPHIPRGMRSRGGAPTDRKPYKRGKL